MTVGSYQIAGGQTKWYFVIDLPRGEDNQRRQHKRRGFPTETAAEKAESDAIKAFGQANINADGTVAAELNKWVAERELDVEGNTKENYGDLFRLYVYPYIGGQQLYSLEKRAVQDMYKALLKEGGAKKQPLSPTTVRTLHRVLMKAFRDLGIDLGPVRHPKPKEREDSGRKGVWNPKQSKQFLTFHRDTRMFAAWALAVVAGCRRGELAGLRWAKVDLDQGIVYIHIQRTIEGKKVVEKAPKGRSRRRIAIGPALVQVLKDHQDRQDGEKRKAGILYHDGDYVFPKENGDPYYPRYFTDRWEKACTAAG